MIVQTVILSVEALQRFDALVVPLFEDLSPCFESSALREIYPAYASDYARKVRELGGTLHALTTPGGHALFPFPVRRDVDHGVSVTLFTAGLRFALSHESFKRVGVPLGGLDLDDAEWGKLSRFLPDDPSYRLDFFVPVEPVPRAIDLPLAFTEPRALYRARKVSLPDSSRPTDSRHPAARWGSPYR